jgi:1,2-phenylacetyl-CoA epoxidase PaaB subunit
MTIFLSSTIPLTYILKESATFRSHLQIAHFTRKSAYKLEPKGIQIWNIKESKIWHSHTKEEKDPPSAYQGSQKKSDKMSRTVGTN